MSEDESAAGVPVGEPIIDEQDDDTLRIMVSTDNHLGYNERDPVRGEDSFAAFEEVLYLSKKYKVDMVLLAGDLFHDNKPSRRTMHRTFDIIRRYCMGPDPVELQIVSNQADNFRGLNGTVNYEDEFFSIDLPIFSIHGNHDDPTRDGGKEMLAALDLLSVSNLVNYFGHQDAVDRVEVNPILIRKGSTKVALYGLGSMRDERLNRMWKGKKVRFLRPDNGEGEESEEPWFNVFALHQNRDSGRGVKNCVHESMIPEWMDFIVWGHEHECQIEPSESVVGTFRITQPGSSVATSLTPSEAVRKHVGILDIKGCQFRQTPIPLTQVRPFFMGEISLSDPDLGLDPEDPKVELKVAKALEEKVHALIYEAKEKQKDLRSDANETGNPPREVESKIKYTLENRTQVLVRLKVDHNGFSVINSQRFGSKFVGKVANPGDILLFSRKSKESTGSSRKKGSSGLDTPIPPEELREMNVDDLISEELGVDKRLEILAKDRMHLALEEYVQKNEARALENNVKTMLATQQNQLIKNRESVSSDEDATPNSKRKVAREDRKSTDLMDDDEEVAVSKPKPTKAVRTGRKRSVASIDLSDDDEREAVPKRETKKAPAPRARRAPKKKPKYAVDSDGVSDESEAPIQFADDDDDEELDDLEVEEEPKPKKRAPAKRKTTVKRTPKKQSLSQTSISLSFPSYSAKPSTAKKKTTKRKKRVVASDDDDEDFGGSYGVDKDWGTAKTNSERTR